MTCVPQHYESLLAEAKSGKESSISRAVEKAVFSKLNDLQAKIEMYTEETKSIAEVGTDQEKFPCTNFLDLFCTLFPLLCE